MKEIEFSTLSRNFDFVWFLQTGTLKSFFEFSANITLVCLHVGNVFMVLVLSDWSDGYQNESLIFYYEKLHLKTDEVKSYWPTQRHLDHCFQ